MVAAEAAVAAVVLVVLEEVVMVVLQASASAAAVVVVVMGSVVAKVIKLRTVVECMYWCESRWWRRKGRTYLVRIRRRSSNSLAAQASGGVTSN